MTMSLWLDGIFFKARRKQLGVLKIRSLRARAGTTAACADGPEQLRYSM